MPKRRSNVEVQVQKVLARFRRQRPLRAGSLIITLFGDALAPRGGEISLGSLIGLTQPFGLTERLVRTSVSRLAADGWLQAERHGRQSDYRLTEHGRTRFAEATRRIYGEAAQTWDGRWSLVILPRGSRRTLEKVRGELKWLGFGQLAPGVLAHPGRKLEEVRGLLRELKVLDDVLLMEATADGGAENGHLALTAWDLAQQRRGYERFISMFEPLYKAMGGNRELEPLTAFIIRTLLIHEYRKVHLRDPLLPNSLLPPDWAGTRAYELCSELYRQTFGTAERHLTAAATTRHGALPALSRGTFERFGTVLMRSETR